MEWIATGVAIIAALVAGWQAWEARRSRLDARSSATAAEEHESRAVAASERIATAIEEQNTRERAAAERYERPFRIAHEYAKSGRRWRIELGGDEEVHDVTMTWEPDGAIVRTLSPIPTSMKPGDAVTFIWLIAGNGISQIALEVAWSRPNGDRHTARSTIS